MFYFFEKTRNKTRLIGAIDIETEQELRSFLMKQEKSLKDFNEKSKFINFRKAIESKNRCLQYNTLCEKGGCLFVIEGYQKGYSFICDELWIEYIKKNAKQIYPLASFYVIEVHRLNRAGKPFEKALNKIKKEYPDYLFSVIDYKNFHNQTENEIKKHLIS